MMFDPAEFRAGQYSVPYSSKDDLPPYCFTCVYLRQDEATVCFCESFFYFCAYSWPDKLNLTIPPCLQES